MGFARFYWQAVRGPGWANAIGMVATAIPLALAIANSDRAWMWVAIALAVVVLAQLLGLYATYRERKQAETALPAVLDDLIRKGMKIEGSMGPSTKPGLGTPRFIGEASEDVKQWLTFRNEVARVLHRCDPARGPDLDEGVGRALDKELERGHKAVLREEERARAEHRDPEPVYYDLGAALMGATLRSLRRIRKEIGP